MFGLSFFEVAIIALLALVLLGPQQLLDVSRTVGKGLRQAQRALEDLKDGFESQTQGLAAELEPRTRELAARVQAHVPTDELQAIPSLMMPVPGREPAAPPPVSPLAALPVPGREPDPAPPPPSETVAAEQPPEPVVAEQPPGTSQA